MSDVCVDTDVASLILKRAAPPWIPPLLANRRVWVSFVTVGELAKWAEVRSWGQPARDRLDAWLASRGILPYDEAVARRWGWLAARAQRRGRPRPQNDMWVAACCIHHDIPLITLNVADFVDFATYDALTLIREP